MKVIEYLFRLWLLSENLSGWCVVDNMIMIQLKHISDICHIFNIVCMVYPHIFMIGSQINSDWCRIQMLTDCKFGTLTDFISILSVFFMIDIVERIASIISVLIIFVALVKIVSLPKQLFIIVMIRAMASTVKFITTFLKFSRSISLNIRIFRKIRQILWFFD